MLRRSRALGAIVLIATNLTAQTRATSEQPARGVVQRVVIESKDILCGDGGDLVATRRPDGRLTIHETRVVGDTRLPAASERALIGRCQHEPALVELTRNEAGVVQDVSVRILVDPSRTGASSNPTTNAAIELLLDAARRSESWDVAVRKLRQRC